MYDMTLLHLLRYTQEHQDLTPVLGSLKKAFVPAFHSKQKQKKTPTELTITKYNTTYLRKPFRK